MNQFLGRALFQSLANCDPKARCSIGQVAESTSAQEFAVL